jgi:hypothetical protein
MAPASPLMICIRSLSAGKLSPKDEPAKVVASLLPMIRFEINIMGSLFQFMGMSVGTPIFIS